MSSDDGHATSDRLKMRLGRASDIWSLGCILYQMVYGRPPFAALNTIQKLSTIPNPKHVIKYADWGDADAVDSMQACLRHDARLRSKIRGPEGLLERAYLQVPSNMQRSAGAASTVANTSSSKTASIGKVYTDSLSTYLLVSKFCMYARGLVYYKALHDRLPYSVHIPSFQYCI